MKDMTDQKKDLGFEGRTKISRRDFLRTAVGLGVAVTGLSLGELAAKIIGERNQTPENNLETLRAIMDQLKKINSLPEAERIVKELPGLFGRGGNFSIPKGVECTITATYSKDDLHSPGMDYPIITINENGTKVNYFSYNPIANPSRTSEDLENASDILKNPILLNMNEFTQLLFVINKQKENVGKWPSILAGKTEKYYSQETRVQIYVYNNKKVGVGGSNVIFLFSGEKYPEEWTIEGTYLADSCEYTRGGNHDYTGAYVNLNDQRTSITLNKQQFEEAVKDITSK